MAYQGNSVTTQKTAWDELPSFITSLRFDLKYRPRLRGQEYSGKICRLSQNTLGRLEKMALSPCFARIDFSPVNYPVPLPVAGQTAFQVRLIHLSVRNPIQVYMSVSSLRDSKPRVIPLSTTGVRSIWHVFMIVNSG